MNESSQFPEALTDRLPGPDERPILVIPYMWIGDFVRCHSVVTLLRQRYPGRAVDLLTSSNTAPLVDFMPGVRKGIVCDLPRRRLALRRQRALARRLRGEEYGHALVMPRTWKAALAPSLAGIPRRTGFFGEARVGLINDMRFGEKRLPRMIDRCAVLVFDRGERLPPEWPLPQLVVPAAAIAGWRQRLALASDPRPVVALAPGAVGPAKRWPATYYSDLARRLAGAGLRVFVVGGPAERQVGDEIAAVDPTSIRNLTGPDLRQAILALAAAAVTVSNDSGLLHVAAALGRPAIGIFGPTSPLLWAPLNPLAAVIETSGALPCRPCHKPVCRLQHHHCMRDIAVERVLAATHRALGGPPPRRAHALPDPSHRTSP
ncbi:MAG: lipopolysaccharide heptosyltransferase II [Proteobacteria bacterium]|nr:lipopolysaccharide heptosyltransferase II [Pseudomonadota bacterium]